MLPLAMALTLKYYAGRRKASNAQIATLVNNEINQIEPRARRDGILIPIPRVTPFSVKWFIQRLPESVRIVRRGGMDAWAKQHRLTDRQVEAQFANHIWEIDHTPLDLNAVRSAEDEDEDVVIWVTACVDVFSGMPMAVFVSSDHPTAFTTSLVLSMAIRPRQLAGVEVGGLPVILRPDHGADFKAKHMGQIAAALGIEVDYAEEHTPDDKPHVERFMRTLNQMVAALPGHKGAEGRSAGSAKRQRARLLTMRQVIEKVNQYTDEYRTRFRKDFGSSPLHAFRESVDMRLPENLDNLDLLLLKTDQQRVLGREGIRFNNTKYKGTVTTADGHLTSDLTGRRVVIRYHPYSTESIYVYDAETNTRLGEFVDERLWTGPSASEENAKYIKPLKERTTAFVQQLKKEDAAAARKAREEERKVLERERQESAALEGRKTQTIAERQQAKKAEAPRQRRRELMADLLS